MKLRAILLFTFISTLAFAQFKPHIGFNWSQLSTEPQDFTHEGRLGFVIGAGFKFGESFYLEPGIQLSYLGTKLISKDKDDNGETIEHQSYVNTLRIPVMVGYDFMDKDDFLNLRVFTGPSASVVMGVTTEGAAVNVTKEDYASTIWGWNFGAGLDVWFVYLDIGFEMGISDFYSTDKIDHKGTKNNAFYVTAGVNLF